MSLVFVEAYSYLLSIARLVLYESCAQCSTNTNNFQHIWTIFNKYEQYSTNMSLVHIRLTFVESGSYLLSIVRICWALSTRLIQYATNVILFYWLSIFVEHWRTQIWVLPGESDRYRIRQVVIILVRWISNSIRISTVLGHAPCKYPPRNTRPRSPVQIQTNSNPPRISWSGNSFSPTVL